jgi:OmpA-OmpF porin, OOP family
MKTAFLTPIGVLLVFLESVNSHASGIYQTDYRYAYGGAAHDSAHRQTFVICEEVCVTGPYLVRVPRFPALSVRVSQDIASVRVGVQKIPEEKNTDNTTKKDSTDKQQGRGASITILFDLDSSSLTDTAKAKLSSYIQGIDAETKANGVVVKGYTCDLGSKTHNDILARRRADAIAAYLTMAGVRPSRILGMGKCCYMTEDPDRRSFNRRGEVTTDKTEVTR